MGDLVGDQDLKTLQNKNCLATASDSRHEVRDLIRIARMNQLHPWRVFVSYSRLYECFKRNAAVASPRAAPFVVPFPTTPTETK